MNHIVNKDLKILIVGAGGIGGITAAQIARTAYNVVVVDPFPGLSDKIENDGLDVSGYCGDFRIKIEAYNKIEDVEDKKDIIFIATKATVLKEVVKGIKPLMKDSSVVVSLQNGICEDYLVKVFGDKRVCGCIVGWGATAHSPGIIEMTSNGSFTLGKVNNETPNHFKLIGEVLKSIVPVHYTLNLMGSLYSKLIINSCITTLGAISGMTLGNMLMKRKFRNIFIQIIKEAVDVAKAKGISIEKYAGSFDFYAFAEDNSIWGKMKKHILIRIIGLKYRKLKSSSLQSLETGRKTEIDFLNGYICNNARRYEVPSPLNNFLVKLVKEIEDGSRQISIRNFDLQYFNQFA